MSILDAQNLFSDAQLVTTTAASTNYIDLGPLATGQDGRDVGAGAAPLYLTIITDTTVQSTASSTVTFSLEKDIYTDFTTAVAVWTSAAVAKATLVAGYRVASVALPKMDTAKYLRVKYTVATADLTTGAFTAYLTLQSQDKQAYVAGYAGGFVTGA